MQSKEKLKNKNTGQLYGLTARGFNLLTNCHFLRRYSSIACLSYWQIQQLMALV